MARVSREVTRQIESDSWELRLQGLSHQQIADRIGRDRSTVSKALKRVEKRVLREMQADVALVKARQTAMLEHIAGQALQAWEESKKTKRFVKRATERERIEAPNAANGQTPDDQKKTSGLEKVKEHEEQRVEVQTGEVAYLDRAMTALGDIRKIWGIDEPQGIAAVIATGEVDKKRQTKPDDSPTFAAQVFDILAEAGALDAGVTDAGDTEAE